MQINTVNTESFDAAMRYLSMSRPSSALKMAVAVSDLEFCNLAYDGRVAMLKASLEKDGSLIRRRDANKRTALHWACSSGRNEVVEFLVNKGAEVL